MAHTLDLYDGTTTTNLSTTNVMLINFTPSTPIIDYEENIEKQTTTETIDLLIYGSTTADVQNEVEEIQQQLITARRSQKTGTQPRVYLQFSAEGDANTYRSEVINGALQLSSTSLSAWSNAKMECTLIIERKVYWEVDGESTAASETGIDNGATGNYVDVSSSSVSGQLPTPAEIQYRNTTGGGLSLRDVVFANNAWNDPANYTSKLSGASLSWGAAVTHSTDQASWALSSAIMADVNGDYFRFFAAFTTLTANVFYRVNIKTGSTLLAHTDEVSCTIDGSTYEFLDLGALPIPPGGDIYNPANITISLSARASGSGSGTLSALYVLPADNLRKIRMIGDSVANNEYLYDDTTDYNRAYLVNASADGEALFVPYGNPVMLYPGRTQRVYALAATASYEPSWAFTLKVVYRERRITVV